MKKVILLFPFTLIVKAADGNSEAINQIIRHYRGYMTKRSLRLMKDEYGNQSMVVDRVLRGPMETRLITSSVILKSVTLSFVGSVMTFPRFPIGGLYSCKAYIPQ